MNSCNFSLTQPLNGLFNDMSVDFSNQVHQDGYKIRVKWMILLICGFVHGSSYSGSPFFQLIIHSFFVAVTFIFDGIQGLAQTLNRICPECSFKMQNAGILSPFAWTAKATVKSLLLQPALAICIIVSFSTLCSISNLTNVWLRLAMLYNT